jgi:hypothetical protein
MLELVGKWENEALPVVCTGRSDTLQYNITIPNTLQVFCFRFLFPVDGVRVLAGATELAFTPSLAAKGVELALLCWWMECVCWPVQLSLHSHLP